jgi:hypothetical protein
LQRSRWRWSADWDNSSPVPIGLWLLWPGAYRLCPDQFKKGRFTGDEINKKQFALNLRKPNADLHKVIDGPVTGDKNIVICFQEKI